MKSHYRWNGGVAQQSYYRTDAEKLIEVMSNWQRQQWSRAGCPRDTASLQRFGRLQRDGSELYNGDILNPQQ